MSLVTKNILKYLKVLVFTLLFLSIGLQTTIENYLQDNNDALTLVELDEKEKSEEQSSEEEVKEIDEHIIYDMFGQYIFSANNSTKLLSQIDFFSQIYFKVIIPPPDFI